MEITERWLMDTAGFQAFKAGRQLFRGGAVLEVTFRDNLLKGMVSRARKPAAAGLRIAGTSDVENLCQCYLARRDGRICEHSIALGFAWMEQGEIRLRDSERSEATIVANHGPDKSFETKQRNSTPSQITLLNNIFQIESNFIKIWEKQKFPLRIAQWTAGSLPRPGDDPELMGGLARAGAWLAEMQLDPAFLPPFLVLNRLQALGFLAAFRGLPNIALSDGRAVRIATESLPAPLTVAPAVSDSDRGAARVALSLGLEGGDDHHAHALWDFSDRAKGGAWLFNARDTIFFPLKTPDDAESIAGRAAAELLAELLPPSGSTLAEVATERTAQREVRWLVEHYERLKQCFRLDTSTLPNPIRVVEVEPVFDLELTGSASTLSARLVADYGTRKVPESTLRLPAGRDTDCEGRPIDAFPIPVAGEFGRFHQRHLTAETAACDRLIEAGFDAMDSLGRWVLRGEESVASWLANGLPEWRERGVKVTLSERLLKVAASIERIAPSVELLNSGDSWFECRFSFAGASGVEISESEIRALLRSGRHQVTLPAAKGKAASERRGVVDHEAVSQWSEMLNDLNATQVEAGRFRIPKRQQAYLLAALGERTVRENQFQLICNKAFKTTQVELREYQKEGVEWLAKHLFDPNAGGAVLADEMGLGKTLQALTIIQATRHSDKSAWSRAPAIVVAPASLLRNWAAEAARFTPQLNVALHHGGSRGSWAETLADTDLIITSYGTLDRDIDAFEEAGAEFSLAVLDEASHVRNPRTRIARSVRRLNAAGRLALTGTPIENSVNDLWSIVDFALPGYLGSRGEFQRRYEKPLSSAKPPPALLRRLHQRVGPYLLRRTKRQVVKDLPDKIEQTLFCDLSERQKALYASTIEASRTSVREALQSGAAGGARMTMLTALLRLRQICCDPGLLGVAELKGIRSAKLDLLLETVREAREGGHRILIFSQFVAMLDRIAERLDDEGCGFARLDGRLSSKQRAEAVQRFQAEDSDVGAFLISLKAGGYGLNLTAADTVIHFDPWWNPAVEAQATDRAHRIGQQQTVTSYKLICRGTVEERILQLQKRKAGAMDGIVDGEAPRMDGLSDDDIREVLEL